MMACMASCYNSNLEMGSSFGYGYRYEFFMVHEDEINSQYKSVREAGSRGLLFEFRTNFILETRSGEEVSDPILDSETFDGYVDAVEDKSMESTLLYSMIYYRLQDYWMTRQEMKLLVKEALAFASEPKHASFNPVPIVVRLDVCTVQQEGESYNAALDRAIRSQNLVPLYLWPQPTTVVPKPMSAWLLNFLKDLDRIRVEDVDKGLALMRHCDICKRTPTLGCQISVLACNHAFHSHCVVRWLEDTNLCPSCLVQAYRQSIAVRPPIVGLTPEVE